MKTLIASMHVTIITLMLLMLGASWLMTFAWPRRILVVYSFTDNGQVESFENLRFFISEAIEGDQRAEYVIVISGVSADSMPSLPSHARYIQWQEPLKEEQQCFSDWGAYGFALGASRSHRFNRFIFISSLVRGPFLPSYARWSGIHWTDPFLQRLQGNVKLVGPTISCQGSMLNEAVKGKWRGNPHVEPYALATDREGLKVLLAAGDVFKFHENKWEASYFGDLGASASILAAGHNLDCFITKYQGSRFDSPIDWRDKSRWECNQRSSLHGEHFVDGVTLDPLEVMFVKVSRNALVKGTSSAIKAEKYTKWLKEARDRKLGIGDGSTNLTVTSNEYQDEIYKFKIPKVLEMKARGSGCFDFAVYLGGERSSDLREAVAEGKIRSDEDLWNHYVNHGQFEARTHRFNCPIFD